MKVKNANNLIRHVENSISKAERGVSKLAPDILKLKGMSSAKVRHLLNNMCTLSDLSYFEVGLHKGSTFISALYQNNPIQAIGCDSFAFSNGKTFSPNGTPIRELFWDNVNNHLGKGVYDDCVVEQDCFTLSREHFVDKVNVYFYDGDHHEKYQKLALTHFRPMLSKRFILIVDDWNMSGAKKGTRAGLAHGFKVLHERQLYAAKNQDKINWWNGLFVGVIEKV